MSLDCALTPGVRTYYWSVHLSLECALIVEECALLTGVFTYHWNVHLVYPLARTGGCYTHYSSGPQPSAPRTGLMSAFCSWF